MNINWGKTKSMVVQRGVGTFNVSELSGDRKCEDKGST